MTALGAAHVTWASPGRVRWHAGCRAWSMSRQARLARWVAVGVGVATILTTVGLSVIQRISFGAVLPVFWLGSGATWAFLAWAWWVRAEGQSPYPRPLPDALSGAARLMAVLAGCLASGLLGLALWRLSNPVASAAATGGGVGILLVLVWRRTHGAATPQRDGDVRSR